MSFAFAVQMNGFGFGCDSCASIHTSSPTHEESTDLAGSHTTAVSEYVQNILTVRGLIKGPTTLTSSAVWFAYTKALSYKLWDQIPVHVRQTHIPAVEVVRELLMI